MFPYLLDTNIVSFILKTPHGQAAERFRMTPAGQIILSSVVEAELRFGTQRMPAGARAPGSLEDFLIGTPVLRGIRSARATMQRYAIYCRATS